MADRGAGSNPPAFSRCGEKFAGSPLGYYALYDNPLKRSVGIPISYTLLALGGLIALAGCFVGEHRVLLWKIGGGLIGLVLLFWIVAAAILLMSGLLQYLRQTPVPQFRHRQRFRRLRRLVRRRRGNRKSAMSFSGGFCRALVWGDGRIVRPFLPFRFWASRGPR